METLKQQPYSPHLKKVLKTYQLASGKSLQGPSNVLDVKQEQESGEADFQVPLPVQHFPILTTPDQSRSERSETVLERETISCFMVGGERRLCLPQVLNGVLHDFSLPEINKVCDELHIFCSRCNPEQLEVLKNNGILPTSAPSCGLITKTDAERLCSSLLHTTSPKAPSSHGGMFSFRVYHECFGKCVGMCVPGLYTDASAECIECLECHGMFPPRRFVSHVHKSAENRTCHWGFDSDNWRCYLQLGRNQGEVEKLEKVLEQFKSQHEPSAATGGGGGQQKRKQHELSADRSEKTYKSSESDLHYVMKKAKIDTFSYPYMYSDFPMALWHPWRALKPSWPAKQLEDAPIALNLPGNLSHSPPVLLYPERVIPMSHSERFERTFQPNVALAPRTTKQEPSVKSEAVIEESAVMKKDANETPLNPEIELSSDETDTDSSTDLVQDGSCISIVQQVVSLMSELSDVRIETMRARVVELVQRLSRHLEKVEANRRNLQQENTKLQKQQLEQEKLIAELQEQLQHLKYVGKEAVSIKEEPA